MTSPWGACFTLCKRFFSLYANAKTRLTCSGEYNNDGFWVLAAAIATLAIEVAPGGHGMAEANSTEGSDDVVVVVVVVVTMW